MRKKLRTLGLLTLGFAAFVYMNNRDTGPDDKDARPLLLAHRGMGQSYDMSDVGPNTCTATRMLPPSNPYLENTIASLRAGFQAGADIAEFDVHPTTDDQFAVFHDWTLDCRTNGTGVTRDHPMSELKQLDIGYGYTADGGKTFPFRGKGIGLMPSLDEVLSTFPDKQFLINIKSRQAIEGSKLGEALSSLPPERLKNITVYGDKTPVEMLQKRLPTIRAASQDSLKTCLRDYELLGWTGYVPQSCRNSAFYLPINIAPYVWGFPHRLQARLAAYNSSVTLIGPWNGGKFGSGIDDPETLSQVPAGWKGAIMTNRIEWLGSALPQ